MVNIATLDSQLHQLECKLRSIRQTSEEVSLELTEKPDDADLQAAVAELEASEANTVRSIDRLNRAKAAAGRQRTANDAHARLNAMRAQADQVEALGDQLEAAGEELLDAIEEGLGPLLQKYERLSSDRSALARALLREGETRLGAFTRDWERFNAAASLKRGPTSQAMTAVLHRIGLGRIGPHVGGLFEIPGPNALSAFKEHSDIRAELRVHFARERDHLRAGVDKALKTVEGQQ